MIEAEEVEVNVTCGLCGRRCAKTTIETCANRQCQDRHFKCVCSNIVMCLFMAPRDKNGDTNES